MILIHKRLSWCSKNTLKKYLKGRPNVIGIFILFIVVVIIYI